MEDDEDILEQIWAQIVGNHAEQESEQFFADVEASKFVEAPKREAEKWS